MAKKMHYEGKLIRDLECESPATILLRMYLDSYSTSKHLFVLMSLAVGVGAKRIGEIGVGRSTVALLYAADILNADMISCDRYDYRDLLHYPSKHRFIVGNADKFYKSVSSVDFLFLDYMSTRLLNTSTG